MNPHQCEEEKGGLISQAKHQRSSGLYENDSISAKSVLGNLEARPENQMSTVSCQVTKQETSKHETGFLQAP